MRRIIIGTRKSKLAQKQCAEFIKYLAETNINFDYSLKTIQTQGDKDRQSPVHAIGQGIFIKELEQALMSKEIDCAVHSLKDTPVKIKEGSLLSCFLRREDVRDCLVFRKGVLSGSLEGLRIGTGCPRRNAFLKEIEPGIEVLPLRGNVDTRLRKLDNGDYDAIVLAACGLIRLGFANRISRYFDPDTFVPAAGQAVICSQTRIEDKELNQLLMNCSSLDSETVVLAERRVLEALEIGCQSPFGVYARFDQTNPDSFSITAKIYLEQSSNYVSERRQCTRADIFSTTEGLISSMRERINNA